MTSEAFAQHVGDFFEEKGYPFMGIEIKFGGTFPLVMLWDDNAQVTRVIACIVDMSQALDATLWVNNVAVAEMEAGRAACGALPCVVWPDGFSQVDLTDWSSING